MDFSYEVSRSLAACEGALLVVDASQGVEAQTVANCYTAIEQGVEVVPVLNKIDLPSADPAQAIKEIEDVIGIPAQDAIHASAKTGVGIEDILESLVARIPPPSGDPADERAAYDEALGALLDGRYAESARRFAAFLQQYPDGDYADNATYWLGESYYVTQNYQVALETFQDLLSRFPDSSKAPDALLKVGYSHYELKDWPQAESVLGQVVERYPDTTAARLAQGRLRALRLEGQR